MKSREFDVLDPAKFNIAGARDIFSGPQVGERLPTLKVKVVAGKNKAELVDTVELAGDKPHLVCLMTCESEGIRGLVMLAKLLKKVQAKSRTGIRVSIVFLGDDPAKMDAVYQQYSKYLPLGELDGVAGNSPDGRSGPGTWGIDRNFPQTIILARGGKVTHNFVFGRHIPYHDGYVFGAVAEVIGEDRETVADWINDEN